MDWDKLDELTSKVVVKSALDAINSGRFSLGVNITTYPQVKIAFDGFGDDGNDENMVGFALFVHKSSSEENFVFPPHEVTPWSIVQRPEEEAIIYCWYNREDDEWDFLEPQTDNDDELGPEKIIEILTKVIG